MQLLTDFLEQMCSSWGFETLFKDFEKPEAEQQYVAMMMVIICQRLKGALAEQQELEPLLAGCFKEAEGQRQRADLAKRKLVVQQERLVDVQAKSVSLESKINELEFRYDFLKTSLQLLIDDISTELHNWGTIGPLTLRDGFLFVLSGGQEGEEFKPTAIRDTDAAQRQARKTGLYKLLGLNSHGQRPRPQKGKKRPKGKEQGSNQ